MGRDDGRAASAASAVTGTAPYSMLAAEGVLPPACSCALGTLDVSPASLLNDEGAHQPCDHGERFTAAFLGCINF